MCAGGTEILERLTALRDIPTSAQFRLGTSAMRYQSPSTMEDNSSGEFSTDSDFVDRDNLNINGDINAPDFMVEVKRARRVNTMNGEELSYTTYDIAFETTDVAFRLRESSTSRRYSDFEWIRRRLSGLDKWRSPPDLPRKRFFGRFDEEFIEARRQGLQDWLKLVLSDLFYLSDMGLHLFLQTEWTVQEIEDYLDGRIPEENLEELFNNYGKKSPLQPHNVLHHFFEPKKPVVISYTPEERVDSRPISIDEDIRELPRPTDTDFLSETNAQRCEATPDSGCFPYASGRGGGASPSGSETEEDVGGAGGVSGHVASSRGNEVEVVVTVHHYDACRSVSRFSINGDSDSSCDTH